MAMHRVGGAGNPRPSLSGTSRGRAERERVTPAPTPTREAHDVHPDPDHRQPHHRPRAAVPAHRSPGRAIHCLVNTRRHTEAGECVDGDTTFFPVTVWAEQAEHVAESLDAGSRVVVLGTIKARSWTSAEGERAGQTLTRLEVNAEVVAVSLQWATASITRAPEPSRPPLPAARRLGPKRSCC
jgi:single-stranded DNA-binding protein